VVPVVPSDLVPELVRARWEERLSYTQIAVRYPYYSRTALHRAIKQASHRTYYQPACAWCGTRFRTARADAKFCRKLCAWLNYWFHHQPDTTTRPPEILAQRACTACGGSLQGKRADARFCGTRCKDRHRRQNKRGKRHG
jgi:hypothetical protein